MYVNHRNLSKFLGHRKPSSLDVALSTGPRRQSVLYWISLTGQTQALRQLHLLYNIMQSISCQILKKEAFWGFQSLSTSATSMKTLLSCNHKHKTVIFNLFNPHNYNGKHNGNATRNVEHSLLFPDLVQEFCSWDFLSFEVIMTWFTPGISIKSVSIYFI